MTWIAPVRRVLGALLAGRSRRERVFLIAGTWIVVLLVWAQVAWTAHHEVDRLTALVVSQRQDNDAMRTARQVLETLASQRGANRPLRGDQAIRLLADNLRSAGLSSLSAIPEGESQARVSGIAGFDAWIEWVGRLHAEAGIRVQRASVEPAGTAGMVKIDSIVAWTEPK